MLSPILNPQIPPIKLIIYINNPPSIELINILKSFLMGNKKIFPIMKSASTHAKIVNILYIFKLIPPFLFLITNSVCQASKKYYCGMFEL